MSVRNAFGRFAISPLLLACLVVLTAAAPLKADKQGEKNKTDERPSKAQLASIVIRGELSESSQAAGLFGELKQNLRRATGRLQQAADDKKISGVVLRLNNPTLGRGRIAELRGAIAKVRKAGKKVYAKLEIATPADYLLATACDEIVMPPSGFMLLPGVRADAMFYKGMFDKLGIEADFVHVGAFKGAAEPLTRESLSPAVRQNLMTLVDDFYEQMVTTIATDRKLENADVRNAIDTALLTAARAKELGLIDTIAYDDEWRESIREQMQVERVTVIKAYGRKKVDMDFSGPTGIFKLMQAMMGIKPTKGGGATKRIALVYAVGGIMPGKSQVDAFGGETMGSDTIVAALRKANKDKRVAAIVLRVNSPGGSAVASDLIWRETVRIKKPLVVSMGDVAASGGYYISMGADRIFAEPGTVTGSIGVVGGKLALKGLFDKVGITTESISRGRNSGMFSSTGKFTESEREALMALMDDTYKQFTTKAAEGRKMEPERLEKLAGGQVWTGKMAQENGLVDELGTLDDAVAAAKKMAGMKEDDKVDLLVLPEPKSFFELLSQDMDEEEIALRMPVEKLLPGVAEPLREAATLHRIFQEPAALVMPFRLEIR